MHLVGHRRFSAAKLCFGGEWRCGAGFAMPAEFRRRALADTTMTTRRHRGGIAAATAWKGPGGSLEDPGLPQGDSPGSLSYANRGNCHAKLEVPDRSAFAGHVPGGTSGGKAPNLGLVPRSIQQCNRLLVQALEELLDRRFS